MDVSSRQKRFVLVMAVALTMLLLGALAGGGVVWRTLTGQMQNPDFLRERLKQLEPSTGPAQAKPALVRVGRAEQKNVRPVRSLVGRLVEVRRVIASSEVSGKIVEFPLEEGAEVQAGKTVLARVDDIWARLALQQQWAQWLSTLLQMEYETAELRRLEELWAASVISESELLQQQTQVAQLEAKLEELQAAMSQEYEKQKRSVVYAPFDGVVVAKHAELGQYVAPGSPLVEIISRGQIDAQLMVPESAVNRIHLGQTIPIAIDPLGEEVEGKVVSITPFGPTASRTFPVRVRMEDPTGRLKVGMSVTAWIQTGPEKPGLVVPKDAVLEKPDEILVWVVAPGPTSQSGTAHPVPVRIDVRMPKEYAVTAETAAGAQLLTPGAQVVIEGGERLRPGQQVQIVP